MASKPDPQINVDALWAAMEKRGWVAADLATQSGVHKSTLSLILRGERPNSPAVIVGRLALALRVSMDYLLGLTNDPTPKSTDLTRIMVDLLSVATQLPEGRQHDLVLIARAFQHASAELPAMVSGRGNQDFARALFNTLERRLGYETAEQALDALAAEFPNLGLGRLGGGDSVASGEEKSA